jgi:hypothetical protein
MRHIRREARSVAFTEHLVGGGRLAIDPDQIIVRVTAGDALVEKSRDRRALGDLDVVGIPRTVVIDVHQTHCCFS